MLMLAKSSVDMPMSRRSSANLPASCPAVSNAFSKMGVAASWVNSSAESLAAAEALPSSVSSALTLSVDCWYAALVLSSASWVPSIFVALFAYSSARAAATSAATPLAWASFIFLSYAAS